MERIGLFGGTFDPPHLGHSILAAEALSELRLDRVLWILTPLSPHKSLIEVSTLSQRIELVQQAISDMPEFEYSEVDVSRAAPYYALDTVRILHEQHPGANLIYIFGGDSLNHLPAWKQSQAFVKEVDEFGVLRRPGYDPDIHLLDKALPGLKEKTTFFNAPRIEISGADIRHRIQNNLPYRYFLLPAVYICIEEKNYYKNNSNAD